MQMMVLPRFDQTSAGPLSLDAQPLTDSTASIFSATDRLEAVHSIRKLFKRRPYHVNMYVEDGYTLLHLAAQRGLAHVLQALLDCGAEIDKLNARGKLSALHMACLEGHANCVRTLIEHGASLRHEQSPAISRLGFIGSKVYLDDLVVPPLPHCCLDNPSTACLYALLEAGASPDVSYQGKTPLQFFLSTAATSSVPCLKRKVELLIEYEARVNVLDPDTKQFPIHTYLCGTKPECDVLEVLLAAGAKLYSPATSEAGAKQRQLPLLCGAVRAGFEDLAADLIAAGADVEQASVSCPDGCSPLQCAILTRHNRLTQLLLSSGACPFTFMGCHSHTTTPSLQYEEDNPVPKTALYTPPDVACGLFKDVALTELLYESGAAPSAQLWQQVCQEVPLMRLVAGHRKWTPDNHTDFPPLFKDSVRALLLCMQRMRHRHPLNTDGPVPRTAVLKIIKMAAFPVRAWL